MKRKNKPKIGSPVSRLTAVREHFKLTKPEMAEKLGIKIDTYYKNESGYNNPSLKSLRKLQRDFGISLDWYLFGLGPMFFRDKDPSAANQQHQEEIKLIEEMPELADMLRRMHEDKNLRYEILSYFYKCMGTVPVG